MKTGVKGGAHRPWVFRCGVVLSMVACFALPACAEEKSEAPACLVGNYRVCEAPSVAARSAPWPELREQLGKLADETAMATSAPDPERWPLRIARVREPADMQFHSGWNDVVMLEGA